MKDHINHIGWTRVEGVIHGVYKGVIGGIAFGPVPLREEDGRFWYPIGYRIAHG